MALRDKVLERVGDAADLTAFEIPLHKSRFQFPTREQWLKLNPPSSTDSEIGNVTQREYARPELPEKWARYIGEKGMPFRKLLSKNPLPGERRGTKQIAKRRAAVRSYLGSVGAFTSNTNRQARALKLESAPMRWRWEITGKIERTDGNNKRQLIAHGTQVGQWQQLKPGQLPKENEFRAAFYDTARAAIRTQTDKIAGTISKDRDGRHGPGIIVSQIYDGDSDEAVFTPDDGGYKVVVQRDPGTQRTTQENLFVEDGEDSDE